MMFLVKAGTSMVFYRLSIKQSLGVSQGRELICSTRAEVLAIMCPYKTISKRGQCSFELTLR
jgi:hypothetical protein